MKYIKFHKISFIFWHVFDHIWILHFSQAQMRRFQKIPDSTSDEVLQVLLSSVYGLPFLPIVDVLDGAEDQVLDPLPHPCHHKLHHLLREDLVLLHLLPHLHVEHLFSSGVRWAQDQQRFRRREQRSEQGLQRFTPIHVDLHLNTTQVPCRGGDRISTDICWHSNFWTCCQDMESPGSEDQARCRGRSDICFEYIALI